MTDDRNVLGGELSPCCEDPATGFLRDGCCRPHPDDRGRHEICAVMTAEFLQFSAAEGNDLITPRPAMEFPGLDPGDRWCLCVSRWRDAAEAGVAPPVVLEATSDAVIDEVSLATLREHAHDDGSDD